MLSKAETERIWLPFTVWLTAAPALLPPRSQRLWLGVNVIGALLSEQSDLHALVEEALGMPELSRRLGTGDAVVIGLGSMMGAGVFAAFGPAARAAGAGLLVGLAIAAAIAYCNATASAQLAAVYPTSGGTYIYGRERLGPWWGFAAGWGFVVGKTASCAAMALTIGTYALPGPWWAQRLVAVVAVIGLTALNYRGITKTASIGPNPGGLHACCPCRRGDCHRGRRRAPVESQRRERLVVGHRVRGSAIGRAAVLRVRRLCADRDDG